MSIYTGTYLQYFPSLVLLDYRLQMFLCSFQSPYKADAIHSALRYWVAHSVYLCMQSHLDCGCHHLPYQVGRSKCLLHK